jgi:hypothetical protein
MHPGVVMMGLFAVTGMFGNPGLDTGVPGGDGIGHLLLGTPTTFAIGYRGSRHGRQPEFCDASL